MHIPDLPLLQDIRDSCSPGPNQLMLVGGAVRDLLLKRHPSDLDLLVALPEHRFRNLVTTLARQLNRHVIHPAGFRDVVRLVSRSGTLDLTRIDPDGIEANLMNRELTVNALALDMVTGKIIDPTGGQKDLEHRILRAPSPDVFSSDPVRTLRLFRFQVELGFQVDPFTRSRALATSPNLTRSAGERIREELFRMLAQDGAGPILADVMDPVLTAIFPSLAAIRNVPQNGYHHLNVFPHTREVFLNTFRLNALQTMIGCPEISLDRDDRIALRLAALFHDTGKADTITRRTDGRITFPGHQYASAEHFRSDIQILKPPSQLVERAHLIIRRHMLFLNFMLNGYRPHSFRKLINIMQKDSPLLALLAVADKLAARGPLAKGSIEQACAVVRSFFDMWHTEGNHVLQLPKLVDGHDVMTILNLKPSPEVGRILSTVMARQLEHPDMTREEALALIREWPIQKSD